ncbi:MAG: hypothetical protein Greene041619_218 [Candidatus Peregrinibacteria bacterium Greene0416_19]|nr:MAG: hypothetical protein Greene041619_218 [Candidatus Peregrinibacteria bacterium Greene0416_19]
MSVRFAGSTAAEMTRRTSLGQMIDQSTMLLMVSIGTLILVLALLILFHENANATKGYRLRGLERERSVLLLEQEVLNMQIADVQSLQHLEQDLQIQSMVRPKNLRYAQQGE